MVGDSVSDMLTARNGHAAAAIGIAPAGAPPLDCADTMIQCVDEIRVI